MLKDGNPEQVAAQLAQQYPEFQRFLEANRGKTVEQLAREYHFNL